MIYALFYYKSVESYIHEEEVDIMLTCELLKMGLTFEDIILIRSDGNLGFGAGINQARPRLGPCSAVLILNPDLRVRERNGSA